MLESRGDKIFNVINASILFVISISMLVPFVNLLAVSLSDRNSVTRGLVSFWPKGFTLNAYMFVMQDTQFWSGLRVSLFVTIVGTFLSLVVTAFAAYPLSKSYFKQRKIFLIFFIITMVFSGGLIPTFLLIKQVGLYDNIWVFILPVIINAYNMLLVKNYFETLPDSLSESAKIDGANEFKIFTRIYLPLSLPTMATVGLFYAVGYWNAYFPGIMYISTPSLKPLQTYLYDLLSISYIPAHELPMEIAMTLSTDSVRAATVFASTIPILIVYPFLQKYFVKGLVVGSDK
jgi:putative aldouronate transport system permease protein